MLGPCPTLTPAQPPRLSQVLWSSAGRFHGVLQLHSGIDSGVRGLLQFMGGRSSAAAEGAAVCRQCPGLAVWLWLNLSLGGVLPLAVSWCVERHSKRAWWRRRRGAERPPGALAEDLQFSDWLMMGLQAVLLAVVLWFALDAFAQVVVPAVLPDRQLHWLCPLQPAPPAHLAAAS